MEQKNKNDFWRTTAIEFTEEICDKFLDLLVEEPLSAFESLYSLLTSEEFIQMCVNCELELDWINNIEICTFNYDVIDEIKSILENLADTSAESLCSKFFLYGYSICYAHYDLAGVTDLTSDAFYQMNENLLLACLNAKEPWDEHTEFFED